MANQVCLRSCDQQVHVRGAPQAKRGREDPWLAALPHQRGPLSAAREGGSVTILSPLCSMGLLLVSIERSLRGSQGFHENQKSQRYSIEESNRKHREREIAVRKE